VAWTLHTAPPKPPSEAAPYDIDKMRNPANAIFDSANCPKGNDASMVPVTDE
jgi:cholesterol transport system auxiliary component